jgi:gamma-butyrobetaine dioxygenase
MLHEVTHEGRSVLCHWADGRRGRFPAIWLRDSCSCAECRDPGTGQRLLAVLDIPEEIAPGEVALTAEGDLEVVWTPGGHRSRYDSAWLRAYAADPPCRTPVLWDASLGADLPRFAWREVQADDRAQYRWLAAVRDLGFALLSGVPAAAGEVERVAALIGYIRETNYGRTFDVVSVPRPTHLAYTARALAPHVDNPYRVPGLGLQMLHCIEAAPEGGESLLVDGFRLAAELKRADPAAFETLTRVLLPFGYRDAETDLYARQPVIALDGEGEPGTRAEARVAAIHYNERVARPLEAPERQAEAFYSAYRKLARLVADPEFEVRFRLAPGDLLLFDNERLLHGRTAYDGNAARRFLQGCYVDRDGLESRLRVLARRLGESVHG